MDITTESKIGEIAARPPHHIHLENNVLFPRVNAVHEVGR